MSVEHSDPRLEAMWPIPSGPWAWPWAATIAWSVVASLGCGPESEVLPVDDGVVETAHLRITTTTDNPICAGTPLLLQGELERIAAALELPLWPEDDKLDVRFGIDAVAEVCSSLFEGAGQSLGCVTRVDGELVMTSVDVAYTAPHELVHAVRRYSRTWSAIPFEEGLAELLSGSDGFPVYVEYPHGDPFVGPLELLEIPRADFHGGYYVAAQSFVSWLWETYGRATLMAYVNDPAFTGASAATPLFEPHFGLPLADAEHAWRNDDRPDPVWGTPCIPERTYSLADGPVEIAGQLDCLEPTVFGASYWMSLWPMCLEVPETTRVRISIEANHGRLAVLSREPCRPGPTSPEATRDKYMNAGDVLEEDIAGCRYRVFLHSQESGFPPTPYTIRIEEIPH